MQPSICETLTSRLIDRSVRPACNHAGVSGQIVVSVLGGKKGFAVDVHAVNAAYASLAGVEESVYPGCMAGVNVAYDGRRFVVFPDEGLMASAEVCVYAAVKEGGGVLAMGVNGEGEGVKESLVMDGVAECVEAAIPLVSMQRELRERIMEQRRVEGQSAYPRRMPVRKADMEKVGVSVEKRESVFERAVSVYETAFVECRKYAGKAHRACVVTEAQQSLVDAFGDLDVDVVLQEADRGARTAYRNVLMRDRVRVDGRKEHEIRPIRCERRVLTGDVHGSALFERGDTQVLACATVGLKGKYLKTEEYVEGGGEERSFFVHYSFPPYATGEAGRVGWNGRREVGHSMLIERAVKPVLETEFPYAVRLSADVLASDGSSSMASVCAGSMALRDAGVPVSQLVAGIAMGYVKGEKDGDDLLLTDILGAEDHFGDMDMKVCGTMGGVTAVQMDTKCATGMEQGVLKRALEGAKKAREVILKEMEHVGGESEMPIHAPRIMEVKVNPALAVKTLMKDRATGLRAIEEACGARLFFDSHKEVVTVEAGDKAAADGAVEMIVKAMSDLQVGSRMSGTVADVKASYAVIGDGAMSGLLHVSKMQVGSTGGRFPDARKLVSRGDVVNVVVLESNRERGVLRFGLLAPPKKHEQFQAGIDEFLSATQVTEGQDQG